MTSERFRIGIDRSVLVAAGAGLLLLVAALFGERVAPHEAIFFVPVHGDNPRPYDPGLVFPLGSDVLGRDLFSLVLAGARATLTIVVLAGLARVAAGALIAACASMWRPARLLTESVAELVSAVPATLVALVLLKVLVKTGDVSLFLFIGALLLTGWAGPYRVIRSELDRLAAMPFTQGAQALGVAPWRLFWRHHLPHLIPVVALNMSQQVVASLVLVAELGVLGVLVGTTRFINIEESLGGLSGLRSGAVSAATISDPPGWGGLLANARTTESLWTTRWLFLVPGVAFAVTALAVAAIGFALARRYARRDFSEDLRQPATAVLGLVVVALFAAAALVPERYAEARAWSDAARAHLRPTANLERTFADAGLRPVGAAYAVQRDVSSVQQLGPASARVGGVTVSEPWPRPVNPPAGSAMRSFVASNTGGGVVDAPLVFVGRGVVPTDHPPGPAARPGAQSLGPSFGTVIKDYADDYAGVEVRGTVVLLVRFMGIAAPTPNAALRGYTLGPSVENSIAAAIKRGASAVIFVDPALPYYSDTNVGVSYRCCGETDGVAGVSPYVETERIFRPTVAGGVPVVVLSTASANTLVAPLGLDLAPFIGWDEWGSQRYRQSASRILGVNARVEVPLRLEAAQVTSLVGEVRDAPHDAGWIIVWSIRRPGAAHPSGDVIATLVRSLADSRVPIIFVDFDPSVDPDANAKTIRAVLGARRVTLVVVLDQLDGPVLRFTTPHGDLIPAFDHYAERAGARFEPTRTTPTPSALGDLAPFLDLKTVIVSGTSGGPGDLRPDAAAVLGYVAGRLALGAEELAR